MLKNKYIISCKMLHQTINTHLKLLILRTTHKRFYKNKLKDENYQKKIGTITIYIFGGK